MAYNSNYTGAQIDAAIEKTEEIDIYPYTETGASFTCPDICTRRFIYTDDDGWCYQVQVNKETDDDDNAIVYMHYDKIDFDSAKVRKMVYKFSYNESTGLATYSGYKSILLN